MNLLSTIGIVFILNIADFVLAPVSNMIITKVLSVEQYGVIGYYNAVVSFLSTLFALGLGLYTLRMIPGKNETEKYRYLGGTLFLQLCATAAGGGIAIIFVSGDFLKYAILSAFVLKLFIVAINNSTIGFLGTQKRNVTRSVANFLDVRLWMVPLIIWVAFFPLTVSSLLWIQALTGVGVSIGCIALVNSRLLLRSLRPDREVISQGISFGLPLILVDLGQYLLDMGNRFILKAYLGFSDIGLYNFVAMLIAISFKLGMLFVYILGPYISEARNKGEAENYRKYISLAIKYFYLFMTVAAIGIVANYRAVVLLFGKADYLGTFRAATILMFYPLLMGLAYFIQLLGALRGAVKLLPLVYFLAAGVNVGCNVLLVPHIGILGTAISSVVGYGVLLTLMIVLIGDPDGVLLMLVKDLRILLVVPACFLALNVGSGFLHIKFLYVLLLNGALFAVLFLFRLILNQEERRVIMGALK